MARGSHSQRRSQQRGGDVQLFQNVRNDLRTTKSISRAEFETLKRRGNQFRAVRAGGCGPILGYEPLKISRTDEDLGSRETRPSITQREMNLIAGQAFPCGRSKTANLVDDLRDNRVDPISGRVLFP